MDERAGFREHNGHYVYREDGRVYYDKLGSGPPLIFLHHIELDGRIWENCIEKFADSFTCYNIDWPGIGRADVPPYSKRYDMPDFSKAILDVLDAIGLQKVPIVAAHSGCVVAVDLANSHPHRISKLVLDGLPYWDLRRGRIVFERWWLPTFTDTTSFDVPVVPLMTWEETAKKNPNADKRLWEIAQENGRHNRRWIRLSMEAITSYDIEAAGKKVTAPTILIYGEEDLLRRGEQRAHEDIKGSILKIR